MKRKKTIRNIRLIGRIGVILAAVVLTTGALLYFIHDSVSAAWFDDNWSHRLKYTFTNTGSAVSNQKVKFDIDTATLITDGKLQSDCGDSRFTDANGIVLQYYLDSSGGACNGASTDYYVLVPTIGVGTTTIYHYYGNPSASNGTEAAQFSQSTFSPNSGPTGGSEENGPAPVAYWKFDEGQGSTAYDLSNNSFDGTLGTGSSAPSWLTEDQCISGKCLRFDGDQDYINVGDTSKLEFGNADSEFSISGWIRLNEVPDDSPAMIISKYNSNSSNREWYFSVNDSLQPLIYMSEDGQNTNTRIETSDTAITVGTWYHLAATVNVSTDVHTLYIDGNEVSTTDAGSDITTIQTGTAEVHIGAVARSSTTPDNLFPGELDEIKVYPYARTADEIKQDFASRGSVHGTSAAFGYSDLGKKLSVGLVGHWKMDESAANGCTGGTNDSCDSSGNGNDGAWTGNATITTGKFDNGVTFDGTGDYISYSDVSSFDKASNENKTISLWVFPDTTPSTNAQVLLVKRDETSPNDGYEMTYRTDRTISLQFDDGPTSSSITTNTSIAEDQWSHITYVIDSSTDTISAYINGIFDKSSTNDSFSNDASNSDNFQIANDYRDASNLDNFDGQIDETRIYNRALTPAEIQTLYNFAPGPLAYWRLDDGKGSTTVTDVSGNASSLVQKSMSPDSSWTPGKLGGGLDFDGTNDYICYDSDGNGTCDSATPLQLLGNMSFGTWVKADAIDDGDVIVQVADFTENQADNTTYQVRFTGTAGDLEYNHEHSSGTNQDISFDTNLSTNRWYYIYFTRDVTTNTVSFYVDGALISSQTYTTDPNGGSTSEFALGTRYGADDFYFNGMLDDVKVYNYVRTQGQIIEDMNGGHPAPGSPVGSTVGHWKFDEGYGDTTYDKSPQVNNGDLAGSCPGAATCPTWSNDGKYGKVLSFDGGDYVSVVDTTALDITPAITLSAWTNFGAALGNYETILGKRDASATEANYGLRNGTGANADEIEFYWATSTVWQVYTTNNANLSTSTWYHILATYDGTNVKIYKDGVLLTGTCTTGTCVTALAADNNTFGIGRAGDYASEYMTGSIDEVKIYPFALTADQVKTVYNQGKAIVMGSTSTDSSGNPQTGGNWEYCPPGSATSCTGPILEWKMDEGSGTSANDASGNGSTGTLTSGPTWQTGKKGSAINFDGTDDYITVANPYGASQTAASFSVWVNFDDPTVVQNIFFRLFGDPLYPRLRTHSGTTLQLQYERDTTIDSLADASITTKCPSNTWCHIAGTFATTGTYLYVNGILVASDTTAVTTFDGGSNALQMGWDSNLSTFMKGKIDDFRLYDYARTAAQIAWEYNRGAPVAHYKFDECQGTTVQDWSPAASGGFGTNDGTITIGATGTNDGPGSCNSGDTSEAWRNGTTGKINASLDFDGTDDYVDFGDISSWDFTATQSFSINFWFKTSVAAPSSDAVMFSKYRASGTTQVWYAALNNSTNYPRFAIYDGTNNPDAVGTTALNDGSWHHYVGVRNVTDDKLYLYIDGKLVNSDTDTTTATLANSHKAHVGGLLNSSDTGLTANTQFDGQIDDVRIYNYALTAAQVKDVMNNGAVRFE